MARPPGNETDLTQDTNMKYAGVDLIGLLIFVAVVIFQIVSQFIKTNQEKKALQPPASDKERDPQQQPRQTRSEPEEYTDPFDELLEALGKKPGQTPPQLPQPPQQTRPSRPIPPLTPSAPLPYPVLTSPKPTPAIPSRQPAPLSQSAPEMVNASNDTARTDAKLAQSESKPVFETFIGSETSASQQAAEKIARVAGAPTASQVQIAYRPVEKSVRLPELVARLRNPVEIRRAIVANEILGTPVGLRQN